VGWDLALCKKDPTVVSECFSVELHRCSYTPKTTKEEKNTLPIAPQQLFHLLLMPESFPMQVAQHSEEGNSFPSE